MRDFFRGPALDRPYRLLPTGRRNRKLPGILLALLLLLTPLGWWATRPDTATATAAAEPLPPPVVVATSSPTPTPTPPAPTTPAPKPKTKKPSPSPSKLERATLAPGRKVSCARVIIAIDQSGSMDSYTTARDNALQQLVDWSRDNLRKRDQLAVVDFSGVAGGRNAPTSAVTSMHIGPAAVGNSGSYYRPVLDVVGQFPKTSCKTALVLLSDGDLQDLPSTPDESVQLFKQADVKFQRLLVPDRSITVPQAWADAFPNGKPVYVDGLNPDETARVIGETIAKIVQTKLVYN
jgi:hypothetical protein